MTRPSWVALHGIAHCFIELGKAVVHMIRLVSFLWFWFYSVCPLMEKYKRLMEASWLWGKLGLVLIGGAIFSKSLIQFFFVNGWDCVPSVLFDLRPNYGESNEENGDLLQKVPCTPAALSDLDLQQATADPGLHWRLLDTHRYVCVRLLWVQYSFLLGPGAHKFLFVPSKSLFPQSCVSSGGSVVWLIVTSSKTAYAIPRSIAPRAPAPVAGHCWPVPPQETLKHSKPGLV